MASNSARGSEEASMIPAKVLDLAEDLFHVVLTIILFLVALGALVFTVVRLVTTEPFFPTGMLQAVNDILFVVIILEIARTVIARFSNGFYQLSRFLIIGVIARFDTYCRWVPRSRSPRERHQRLLTEQSSS